MVAAYRDSIEGIDSGTTISVAASGLTVAADDALVLHVWGFNTLGTPSGSDVTWTELESDSATGPYGDTCSHKVFVGIAPDAALSDFTISNGKDDSWFYTLCSVSDADTTTPVDDSAINAADSAAGAPTAPSVSPTGEDSLLICGVGLYPLVGDAVISGAPSGMTLREDGESWEAYGMATLGLSASGATGTKVFSRTGSGTYAYLASSVAIKTASAGGGATVTPGVASLTTTGFAPTVQTPRTVTPGVLTLVTAGQAPTVLTPRVVAPGILELVTAGQAPTVLTPRVVAPGVLSLTTAGQVPTVLTPRVVAPGVLALTTSLFAPSVTGDGSVSVAPGILELVTAGQVPTVLTPRVVEPGLGALVTAGQAPTVLTPRVVAPGVLALTTSLFAPTVATPVVVTPGAAALVLAAFAPVLLLPVVVAPGSRALALTAFVPVVSNGEQILVPGTVVLFDKPAGWVLLHDWAREAAVRDSLAGHLVIGDGP